MGIVIWYKLVIPGGGTGGGTLRVSNDVFNGDFVLDANITLDMSAEDVASTFKAALVNLPGEVGDRLRRAHAQAPAGRPLTARVFLGYFDDLSTTLAGEPVMEAAVTFVRSTVGDDGLLRTELRGEEIGGYRLRNAPVRADQAGESTLDDFVKKIADTAKVDKAANSLLLGKVKNYTLRATTGLQALREIADKAQAPLVIRDNTVYIGKAVGAGTPYQFTPATNIVCLAQQQENDEDLEVARRSEAKAAPKGPPPCTTVELTALGDPGLRVGQPAVVRTRDPKDTVAGRVYHVTHSFSTASGYTCAVRVIVADPGQPAGRTPGAQGIARRIRELAEGVARPAIDVGEVTSYDAGKNAKHLADLKYGQSPPAEAVAPSVEQPVNDQPVLHAKPISSPFAWHNCGLVVPVYPEMRALLAHNRGSVNDAVVAGFLWAEQPAYSRPKNEDGDWWLCLPTRIENGKPAGKGVNDLTDKDGLRVIQARGLQITVEDQKLPDVGERPSVPAEGTLVIEHKSGTTITVDADGAVKVETKSKGISLSNGSAEITLSGGKVALKGTAVEVA
jgi:hypothetical protein